MSTHRLDIVQCPDLVAYYKRSNKTLNVETKNKNIHPVRMQAMFITIKLLFIHLNFEIETT